MTIRERAAEFATLVRDHPDETFLCLPATKDRSALLAALDELAAMIPKAYCVEGRFETCGDPFCSEARERRDAILARIGAS